MVSRFLVLGAAIALSFVPAAAADGAAASPGAVRGADGATSPGVGARYVALPARGQTVVAAIRKADGHVIRSGVVAGSFGVPLVTFSGVTGGLSADGRTLVLAETEVAQLLRSFSEFRLFDTKQLQKPLRIRLRGDFAFDALSPDGRILFLIQHLSLRDLSRYVVRAYDVEHQRLLPQRIADRTQRGWVMTGYPMARATSPDARFVYTLYQNPGGYPFVHALDTVSLAAHCIGIPWRAAKQDDLWKIGLFVTAGGKRLELRWRDGRRYVGIDTRTFRIVRANADADASQPAERFPWWPTLAAALTGAAILGAAVLAVRRRRSTGAPTAPKGKPATTP